MLIDVLVALLVIGIAIMIPLIFAQNNRLAKQRELIAEKRGELKALNEMPPPPPPALPQAEPPSAYHIGQTVFWNGQLGECSGKIIDITRPENSDYVLVLDIGDGVEMPHSARDVWATPASRADEMSK